MSKALGFSGSKASMNPGAMQALNYLNNLDTSISDNTTAIWL